MCGRYHIGEDTVREIGEIVGQVEKDMQREEAFRLMGASGRDIHPADTAPVLVSSGMGLTCMWQRWGFPGFRKNQVIFNARCESALEKPLFRESILRCRAIIPAAWFYEWDRKKQKHMFYRKGKTTLFMAGCCRRYESGEHFVILTTRANASMEPVHERMPLVLEREEALSWLLEDGSEEELLHKLPPALEHRTEYDQISLFDRG